MMSVEQYVEDCEAISNARCRSVGKNSEGSLMRRHNYPLLRRIRVNHKPITVVSPVRNKKSCTDKRPQFRPSTHRLTLHLSKRYEFQIWVRVLQDLSNGRWGYKTRSPVITVRRLKGKWLVCHLRVVTRFTSTVQIGCRIEILFSIIYLLITLRVPQRVQKWKKFWKISHNSLIINR